ncbi:MAG: sugar isomerase, partial [Erysipelotrichaceae bacterium]|nr:sugar isomerase [Erysipelotrichaceae bacterium]
IAVEGALKLMETPKLYLAFGYEAEDGIHGPCYAFRKGDAIIFLNDGEEDYQYAESMVRFSKNELGAGFMFGPKPVDGNDLVIEPASKYFREIEFVPSVQVIAYEMAIINGVEVLDMSVRIPHVSTKYFQTHRG